MTDAIPPDRPDRPVVFDGHNDALLRVYLPERGGGCSFLERSETGHLDLPRAIEGGFGGGFFAIFVPPHPASQWGGRTDGGGTGPRPTVEPAPPLDPAYARQHTLAMVARLFQIERASDGRVRVARTADDVEDCLRDGVLAAVMHLEGADAIDPDLCLLEVLVQAGLRSLGLVWSRPNLFACGVPFKFPGSPDTGPGLTDLGRNLVRACRRLGVVVDLSHLNERGFWDVAELGVAPLVATHSACHAICPSTRNLTDKQLDAIGASGGVVGVNFFVADLRPDGWLEPDTPVTEIVRHVRYIADRIGIEHVALGSDFDGAMIPVEMGDAAGLPRLIDALREGGFSAEDVRAIAHGNWLRILRETPGGRSEPPRAQTEPRP